MRHIHLYSLVNRRQRRKIASGQSLRRRLARIGLGTGAIALLLMVAGVLVLGVSYTGLVSDLPPVEQVPVLLDPQNGPLLQPTRIYDRSGTRLLFSLENPGIPRRYLFIDPSRPDHFSPELVRVSVAILDPDFWQNPGFRPGSLFSLEPETIAERLSLNLLLWQEPPGLRRSLRMRLLAAQLIAQYGRVQVLEWYLNSAYFGHLAYGADSAARLYLNHPASQLDLAGAALLIAVHQAPGLDPIDAPSAALEQQQAILAHLRAIQVISEDEERRALSVSLKFPEVVPQSASSARAFVNLAVSQLSTRFGRDRVERGGLRVVTTLDYPLQLELSCLIRTQMLRLASGTAASANVEGILPDGSPCQSARLLATIPEVSQSVLPGLSSSALVLDPGSGQVLALSGDTSATGESEKISQHAPGSLLTPFIAVAGFARGVSPSNLAWDIPSSLPADLAKFAPADQVYHGPVRLRVALANDYLAPLAQLLEQLGAQNVWSLAGALGLTSLEEDTRPDLIYSGGSVSLLELAQSYAVLAAEGVMNGQHITPGGNLQPFVVRYVEDEVTHQPLWDAEASDSQVVLSAPLAYLVHYILSDSTTRRPSMGFPNDFEIGRPVGAKIGRVSDGSGAWAAGYTRQRMAIFWTGYPEGQSVEKPVDPRLSSGLWHALMQYIHRDLPVEDWPEPSGISHQQVCDPSGQLPTTICPNVVDEIFLDGNVPTAPDSLYQVFQINRETGRLATVFTPPALVIEKTFLVAPHEARAWVLAAGLPLPPEDYDAIQPAPPLADVNINTPQLFDYVHGKVTIRGTASGAGFSFYQLQAGQGLNPPSWLQITAQGKAPINEGVLGVWDTQGLDGLYAIRLLVVRADQTVETAVIQVTVDNTPPLVRVLSPLPAQVFNNLDTRMLILQAQASDGVKVTRVTFWVDGKMVGESLLAPYALPWQFDPGEHTLVVKATDPAGNEGESETINFTVK